MFDDKRINQRRKMFFFFSLSYNKTANQNKTMRKNPRKRNKNLQKYTKEYRKKIN